MEDAAQRAKDASPVRAASAPDTPVTPPPPTKPRRRAKPPQIDIDRHIQEARQALETAKREMKRSRQNERNHRRQKQRLMKKAAGLSADDLERIAVLKRCGAWDTTTYRAAPPELSDKTSTVSAPSAGMPATPDAQPSEGSGEVTSPTCPSKKKDTCEEHNSESEAGSGGEEAE